MNKDGKNAIIMIWNVVVTALVFILPVICISEGKINYRHKVEELNTEVSELQKEKSELKEYISSLEKAITEQKNEKQTKITVTKKYYAVQPKNIEDEGVTVKRMVETPKKKKIDISKSTSISGLTSDEFNKLIDIIADHRKIDCCVFTGTGEAFETVENEYGINGLYLLAIFTNESGFGENNIRPNNAAGIKIGGEYTSFDSINECILYLGNLLKTYNEKYERDTFSEIGDRYCPGNQEWIDDNNEACNLYADFAYKNIYEST